MLVIKRSILFSVFVIVLTILSEGIKAQSGGENILFGDFKIDESRITGITPLNFDLILYSTSGSVIGRQSITNNGRYRFMNLRNGEYYLVVEMENIEVARITVMVSAPIKTEIRRDILLEWRPNSAGTRPEKVGSISATDYYERSSAQKRVFDQAVEAIEKKNYDQAILLLRGIITDDPKDFPAWTELATIYLQQGHRSEAEQAYARAVELRPTFFPAVLGLGALNFLKKDFAAAITLLTQAVGAKPNSAEANYLLGESYLQVKKGSKAVKYLYEALSIDPVGRADIHLRLAALYNGAGMKNKAAVEYEEFLKKKPTYPDRKKLEQYIAANKGSPEAKKN